jgi:hypothetical protein
VIKKRGMCNYERERENKSENERGRGWGDTLEEDGRSKEKRNGSRDDDSNDSFP